MMTEFYAHCEAIEGICPVREAYADRYNYLQTILQREQPMGIRRLLHMARGGDSAQYLEWQLNILQHEADIIEAGFVTHCNQECVLKEALASLDHRIGRGDETLVQILERNSECAGYERA